MEFTKLSQTKILINRMHWPVTTLGYGKRVGIWFQGCSIGCKGCCSRDTWEANDKFATTSEKVMAWVKSLPIDEIDGVTISGGEPFDQPEALNDFVIELRAHIGDKKDILVYSGYPYKKIQKKHPNIIQLVDVLITEPFKESRPVAPLRGSDNQHLHLITPLAYKRHQEFSNLVHKNHKQLQIEFDGEQLLMIGIPGRGDLAQIKRKFAQSGITFHGISWDTVN